MSVNKHLPHVLVLPEDAANRQIANGFVLDAYVVNRRIQVLSEVGGWAEVIDRFKIDHVLDMERNTERFMVLLVDFDQRFESRLRRVKVDIPEHLADRVFVLGAFGEPEELRQAGLGTYEAIGMALAKDCREGTTDVWGHELLSLNKPELARLREAVRPFLFGE